MSWRPWKRSSHDEKAGPARGAAPDLENSQERPSRWSLGILNDKKTDEVPGSVVLLPNPAIHNEPLGVRNAPARTSSSSLPSPYRSRSRLSVRSFRSRKNEKKKTADGKIVLNPQPEDTMNDPLNWSERRRDATLLSIGFYCMLGGGMTPILAAGFSNVADTYGVSEPRVALTTGLYMMGLGIGSVVASPTAILFGKRPVYLAGALLFILASIWCATSPSFVSLLLARIVQGIAVSPVECLPSATVAEIFFLHERAYRLGIYTLLLLGGKNIIPLVSAVIIGSLGWRWVFWIVAIIVGVCFCLLFLFVPETFWDRTPTRHHRFHDSQSSFHVSLSSLSRPASLFRGRGRHHANDPHKSAHTPDEKLPEKPPEKPSEKPSSPTTPVGHDGVSERRGKRPHVGFAGDGQNQERPTSLAAPFLKPGDITSPVPEGKAEEDESRDRVGLSPVSSLAVHSEAWKVLPRGGAPQTPVLHNLNSPFYDEHGKTGPLDYFSYPVEPKTDGDADRNAAGEADKTGDGARKAETSTSESPAAEGHRPPLPTLTIPEPRPLKSSMKTSESADHQATETTSADLGRHLTFTPAISRHSSYHGEQTKETDEPVHSATGSEPPSDLPYTAYYRRAPAKTFLQTLKPHSGRLSDDNWLRVAVRPFILFAYPAVLWSAVTYAFSVGWLIVLSESVSVIYRDRATYNFSAIQCGLVYLSPFVGGILGTAVAGKVSDVVVRALARRNDGVYEPEFRLVMAVPVALTTSIGLMGFGWSAEERDAWIVPTVFFGVISFGCCLGSTTAITFCVDSYRQYAGEALVTLNFSKNIFHGLVFSLFFTHWLESDGPKIVFIAIGIVQLACLIFAVPMYVFGKRARMWTVRKNLMEKF